MGWASTTDVSFSYTTVHSALLSDASSGSDALAIAHLPTAPAVNMMLNYTNNSPNGVGSPTPYLDNDGDANNTSIIMTKANAKALGLRLATDPDTDGTIRFSSSYAWDFDPSDGITAGSRDFVGVAVHEIGHALGFFSGVDELDTQSTGTFRDDDYFRSVYPLDLYRRPATRAGSTRRRTASVRSGSATAGSAASGTSQGNERIGYRE